VITRLINGDPQGALDLAMRAESPELVGQPNFLLAKGLALAANGRMPAARAAWMQLEDLVRATPGTPPDKVLESFTISPFFSRRMVSEAQRTGLIKAS
jgi:hypothetical protein